MYEDCIENIHFLNVEAYISSVYECSKALINTIKMSYQTFFPILSQSFIRLTFNDAYDSNSALMAYKELDVQFRNTSEIVLKRPIKQLSLRPEVMRKVTRHETVAGLAQATNKSLSDLQWMCNPLDMSYAINQVLQSIPSIFNTPSLTRDESIQIMLGIIANDPPSNPVSIAKFLDDYTQIILSLDMVYAIDVYKNAINTVVNFCDMNDDM